MFFPNLINKKLAVYLIIVFCTLILKLNSIGQHLWTDELTYLSISKFFFDYKNLYGNIPLTNFYVYPILVSQFFSFDVNVIFLLRLIDIIPNLIFAVILTYIILCISKNKFVTLSVSLILLYKLNVLYLDAGFKNSIILSYIPLLLSFVIYKQSKNIILIAFLLSLATILREYNLFFSLYILTALFLENKKKDLTAFYYYVFFSSFFLLIWFAKSNFEIKNFFFYYLSVAKTYDSNLILPSFIRFSYYFLKQNIDLFLIFFIITLYLYKFKKKIPYQQINFLFFSFGLCLIPLIEILTKMSYTYHFANSYLGIALFFSYASKIFLEKKISFLKKKYLFFLVLPLLAFNFSLFNNNFDIKNLKNNLLNKTWSNDIVNKSAYVQLAKELNKFNEGTFLTVRYIYIYPLINLKPVTIELNNLPYFFRKENLNFVNENQYLKYMVERYSPSIIYIPDTPDFIKNQKLNFQSVNDYLLKKQYKQKKFEAMINDYPKYYFDRFNGYIYYK